MRKVPNPWQERFRIALTPEAIRQRATIEAVALTGLEEMELGAARDAIRLGLARIHYVNTQELDLLVRLVGMAQAHSASAYPSVDAFAARLNQEAIDLPVPPPICLTGLAGGGKSSLLQALARVLPANDEIELGAPFTTKFPLEAFACAVVKAKTALTTIMHPFLPPDARPKVFVNAEGEQVVKVPKMAIDVMLDLASRRAYSSGHSMHGLDELQFLTQSAAATTKLARAVLSIATLNTPLIYVINYSGCHRLLKRPQEERDRLLADQKVLMPDMPGTSDSENLLKQFTILLERVLDFELVDEQVELFNFTVNIRRKLALLLELSYVEMRRAKTSKITMDHVRAAHKSKAYGEMRAQVGAIFEQAYARKMLRGRSDLWCPFGEEFNRLTPVVQAANNEKSKVVLMRLAAEQLTAREHRTVDALHAAQREARSAHPAKAAVVKLPSRRKAEIDAQTLLADTVAHRSNPPTT